MTGNPDFVATLRELAAEAGIGGALMTATDGVLAAAQGFLEDAAAQEPTPITRGPSEPGHALLTDVHAFLGRFVAYPSEHATSRTRSGSRMRT